LTRSQSLLGLGISIALGFAVAFFGAQFPPGAWYEQLAKPAFTPPNALFGPVWTAIYVMMGVAAWLVWREKGLHHAAGPLTLYASQLALNAAWSWLFFGLQRPDLALADIVVLWVAILATMVAFWRHHVVAGALFIPYLAWVSFAVLLNFSFWQLNR
jgi:translocator protein